MEHSQFNKAEVIRIIEQTVAENNYLLIETVFRGQSNSLVIEIFIDGDEDLLVDQCADVSRKIISEIEKQDLIKKKYRLDVSSPGVDRPLKYLRQYKKHINRNIKIEFANEAGVLLKKQAKLIRVEEENLVFFDKEELTVKFNSIKNAKVLISFS